VADATVFDIETQWNRRSVISIDTSIIFVAACLRIVRASLFGQGVPSTSSQQPMARLLGSSAGKAGNQSNRHGNAQSPVSGPAVAGRCNSVTNSVSNIRVRLCCFTLFLIDCVSLSRKTRNLLSNPNGLLAALQQKRQNWMELNSTAHCNFTQSSTEKSGSEHCDPVELNVCHNATIHTYLACIENTVLPSRHKNSINSLQFKPRLVVQVNWLASLSTSFWTCSELIRTVDYSSVQIKSMMIVGSRLKSLLFPAITKDYIDNITSNNYCCTKTWFLVLLEVRIWAL